jgi:hypothetical protein
MGKPRLKPEDVVDDMWVESDTTRMDISGFKIDITPVTSRSVLQIDKYFLKLIDLIDFDNLGDDIDTYVRYEHILTTWWISRCGVMMKRVKLGKNAVTDITGTMAAAAKEICKKQPYLERAHAMMFIRSKASALFNGLLSQLSEESG